MFLLTNNTNTIPKWGSLAVLFYCSTSGQYREVQFFYWLTNSAATAFSSCPTIPGQPQPCSQFYAKTDDAAASQIRQQPTAEKHQCRECLENPAPNRRIKIRFKTANSHIKFSTKEKIDCDSRQATNCSPITLERIGLGKKND